MKQTLPDIIQLCTFV